MITVAYTNISSSTIITSVTYGNLSVAPGSSVTTSSLNPALDSQVTLGSMTRLINGKVDNITSDDGLWAGQGSGGVELLSDGTGVISIQTRDAQGALITRGIGLAPITSAQIAAGPSAAQISAGTKVNYQVSDGVNVGAQITVATPTGGSSPTWVWSIWPQSAFINS